MPSSNTYTNRVAFIASKEPLVNLLLVRRVRQDLASPALYLIIGKILPQPSRIRFSDFKHLIVLMLRQLAPVPFKHKAFRQTLVVPNPVAIKESRRRVRTSRRTLTLARAFSEPLALPDHFQWRL